MENNINKMCKSFTSLEQSKKLAEILPLESADMAWCNNSIKGINYTDTFSANLYTVKEMREVFDSALRGWDKYWELIPCWSLAALLDVLESEIDGEEGETYQLNIEKDGTWWNVWYRERYDEADPIETESTEDLVDACYELIIKLHEQKLL